MRTDWEDLTKDGNVIHGAIIAFLIEAVVIIPILCWWYISR
jgi:hypothetical protein